MSLVAHESDRAGRKVGLAHSILRWRDVGSVVLPKRLVKTCSMEPVTNSRKFHLVIPKSVRERMNLTLEQRWTILAVNDLMGMVPKLEATSLRSFAADIDRAVPRDDDRV